MQRLSSYPNVFNTCLVLVRKKGFALTYDKAADTWNATKGEFSFLADNPIELLGLIAVFETLKPEKAVEYWWQIQDPDVLSELNP